MSRGWKIILFAGAIRLLFLAATPLEENNNPFTISAFNDERAHMNYIIRLAEDGRVPVQTHSFPQSHPQGIYDFEYYQPPLSYWISSIFYTIFPPVAKNTWAMRAINLILGCLTVLTIGQTLMMLNPAWGWAGMGFLAVFASHARFSATVTNDNLLWLFAALFAYFGIRLLRSGELLDRLRVVLCVAAAVWCKLSGVGLLPALIAVIFMSYRRQQISKRLSLCAAWIVGTIVLIIPLFIENLRRYGEMFPMEIGLGPAYGIFADWSIKRIYLTANYLVHSFYFPFENHWMGAVQAVIFLLLGLLTLVIVYFALKRLSREWRIYSKLYREQLIFLGLILLTAMGGIVFMISRFHQSEARLSFTALTSITLLLMIGLEDFLGRRKWRLAQAAVLLPAIPYLLFVAH